MRSARIHSQTSDGGGGAGRAEAAAGRPLRRRDARWSWSRGASCWPRVRRLDGCLGAIAMAPRLKPPKNGWRKNSPAGLICGGEIFQNWRTGSPEKSCDGVLLDLGVSSPQLDTAERGFSFQQDGPLDMRMDDRQPLTAADLVNGEDAETLAKIFWEYGDERDSRRFAKAIVHDRALRKFETTKQLADLIERLAPRHGKKAHPATKVFQALRIAVNDEIGSLKRGLDAAVKILKPGGRLAVITFHSLEDRVVKEFGRERTRDYTLRRRSGRAGAAAAARAGIEMGFAQGDFAGRSRVERKSARPQRAVEGSGKNLKWRRIEKIRRRRSGLARC